MREFLCACVRACVFCVSACVCAIIREYECLRVSVCLYGRVCVRVCVPVCVCECV